MRDELQRFMGSVVVDVIPNEFQVFFFVDYFLSKGERLTWKYIFFTYEPIENREVTSTPKYTIQVDKKFACM